MKTTLVKIDSSNNRRKILSLNEEDMKAFILLFKNMEELKDYFSSNDEEYAQSLLKLTTKIKNLVFSFKIIQRRNN